VVVVVVVVVVDFLVVVVIVAVVDFVVVVVVIVVDFLEVMVEVFVVVILAVALFVVVFPDDPGNVFTVVVFGPSTIKSRFRSGIPHFTFSPFSYPHLSLIFNNSETFDLQHL